MRKNVCLSNVITKFCSLLMLILVLVLALPVCTFAGSWHQDTYGRWFELDNGSRVYNGWFYDNSGDWYFSNASGYLLCDMKTPDGYYVGPDGRWDGRVAGIGAMEAPGKALLQKHKTSSYFIRIAGSKLVETENYYEVTGTLMRWVTVDQHTLAQTRRGERIHLSGFTIARRDVSGEYTMKNITQTDKNTRYTLHNLSYLSNSSEPFDYMGFSEDPDIFYFHGSEQGEPVLETIGSGTMFLRKSAALFKYGNISSFPMLMGTDLTDMDVVVRLDEQGFITMLTIPYLS